MTIRPITDADRPRLSRLLRASWGSTQVARLGRLTDAMGLAGFAAHDDTGDWLGYALYEVVDVELEIVVLESTSPGRGAGSALLGRCVALALDQGLDRVWLITTNDNLQALRFYQRCGFVLAALHRDAVTRSRATLKPEIPELGLDGIPIRDEIELELPRATWPSIRTRYSGLPPGGKDRNSPS